MRRRRWLFGALGLAASVVCMAMPAGAQSSGLANGFVAAKDLKGLFKDLPQPQVTEKPDASGTSITMCGQTLPFGAGVKRAQERDLQAQRQQPPTASLAFEAIYQLSSAADAKAAVAEANRLAKSCQSYPSQSTTIVAAGVPKLKKLGDARAALRTTFTLANGVSAKAVVILEARGAYVVNLYVTTTRSFTDKDIAAWAAAVDRNFKKVAK
jgi:hypothetical protein